MLARDYIITREKISTKNFLVRKLNFSFLHFNTEPVSTYPRSSSSIFSFSFSVSRSMFLKKSFIWCRAGSELFLCNQHLGRAREKCRNLHTKAPCLPRWNSPTEINTRTQRHTKSRYFMFHYGNFMLAVLRCTYRLIAMFSFRFYRGN